MLGDWSITAEAARNNDPMAMYREKRDRARKSVHSKYTFLGFISSGTYGRVYKVEAKNEKQFYAVKKFKPDKDGEAAYTGISQSAIREIALNREISHENIAALKEVILEDKSIYMVFEYAEHDFLQVIHHHTQHLRSQISPVLLKSLVYQLFNGVHYLHTCHILHRDLKPANILITSSGIVKIGDLGLARLIYEPLQPLTSGDRVVVTIWYRAPELLLGAKHYNKAIDIWAAGCVLAELASVRPIFKGEEEKMDSKKYVPFQRDQLLKIFEVRGTPNVNDWPNLKNLPEYQNMKRLDRYPDRLSEWCHARIRSKEAYDLLRRLFEYDPDKRLTAKEAMEHAWFKEEPKPTRNVFLSLMSGQIPPPRRLTQDEASSLMMSTNAAPRAPPPANSVRPPSAFTTGMGPGAPPPAAATASYATGTTYGAMNMSRVPVVINQTGDNNASNSRKKPRLG